MIAATRDSFCDEEAAPTRYWLLANVAAAAMAPSQSAGDLRNGVMNGSTRKGMIVSLVNTSSGNTIASVSARCSSVNQQTIAIAQKYAASASGVAVTITVTRLAANAHAPSSESSTE